MKLGLARFLAFAMLATLGAAATPACHAAVIREDNSELQRQIGVPLYVWRDPAVSSPSAVLVAVHGSAQDGAVMDGLAHDLVPRGFVVIAPDVRGDGRWQGAHAPTEMANVELMETAADVSKILTLVNKSFPHTKIYCLGESIGAGVVLRAVSETPRNVKGVVLVSAGVRPHPHDPRNMKSSFIKGMALLVHPVDLTDYITRYCSEDPRIVKEMLADPLGKNRQTGLDLLGTFMFLHQEPQFAAMMPKNIPVLAIQGTQDQIVDPSSIDELLGALPQKTEKQLVMIPGCGHIIVGTQYLKPMVLSTLHDWFQKHGQAMPNVRETAVRNLGNGAELPIPPSGMSFVTPGSPEAAGQGSGIAAPQNAGGGLVNPADFEQPHQGSDR